MGSTDKVKLIYQKGFAQGKKQLIDLRLKKILNITQKQSSKPIDKLLDLGCGDGTFTLQLSKILKPRKVYGIDISQEAVHKLNSKKINGYCFDIDQSNLPFPSNYLDFIYCGNLVELVADADHLLKEIHRTLKKSGTIIMTFPNIASWLSRIALVLGYLPYYSRVSTSFDLGKMFLKTKPGHSTGFIRLFTVSSFSELAKLYDLKVEKTYGIREETLPIPLQIVDNIISHFPSLAFKIICVLTKA
ncbi:class I SAM-dependent methyltransferase [Candidatus Roizmanbacteria bacterium]|nr:class I SAM-dependent methyltransferase [Candidatus Roizmanbacteria bacterium]